MFFIMSLSFSAPATEYNLYYNAKDPKPQLDGTEFEKLSLEDQYVSYMSSFRYVGELRGQELTYARLMVKKYGRDVLPLLDKDLLENNCFNFYRKPYDNCISLISYILSYLKKSQLLKEEETILYTRIYEKKLEDYVRTFKIIDGTVYSVIQCIIYIRQDDAPAYLCADENTLKNYYEKKLGITGVVAGNFDSRWE